MLVNLGQSLPSNHRRMWMHDGEETAVTIREMQRLVTAAKRNFETRVLVGGLIRECPKKDYFCYAQTIFNFWRDKIQYAYDPSGVELVESPTHVLRSGIADCDSVCVGVASSFEEIGLPARFVTIKADKKRPDDYSHVFVEVNVPGRGWLGADCTMPFDFGWIPPKDKYPRKEWPASLDEGENHDPGVMGMDGLDDCHACSMPMNGMGAFQQEDSLFSTVPADAEAALICNDCRPNEPVKDYVYPAGMSGLGASMSTGEIQLFLEQVASGEKAAELQAARRRSQENLGYTFTKFEAAKKIPINTTYGQIMQQLAGAARKSALDANAALQEAINKYNTLAGDIRTRTAGAVKPQLADLGLAPAVIVGLASIGGVAVAVIAITNSYNNYIRLQTESVRAQVAMKQTGIEAVQKVASSGAPNSAQTIAAIQKILETPVVSAPSSGFDPIGGITGSIGTVALLGVAGFFLFSFLKKKGTI